MLLSINKLSISVGDMPIVHDFSLDIAPGEVHAIMGPNGSGKSTLAYTLMGHPSYLIKTGSILFNNESLIDLSPDKRAQKGMFLVFQQPYEIPGVSIATFLKEAYQAIAQTTISVSFFNDLLHEKMKLLAMDPSIASRSVNEGFSGGEKKRLEMLQILLFKPKLVIVDEIDSGLDVDALKLITHAMAVVREENPEMSFLLITHYHRILEYIKPDYVHILSRGMLVDSGGSELALKIEKNGYAVYQ